MIGISHHLIREKAIKQKKKKEKKDKDEKDFRPSRLVRQSSGEAQPSKESYFETSCPLHTHIIYSQNKEICFSFLILFSVDV